VSVLLQRTANEKQFIRDLARDALTICVESNPSEKLLTELLRISITEKNAQIVNAVRLSMKTGPSGGVADIFALRSDVAIGWLVYPEMYWPHGQD
jgi:hypothetical protein